MLLPVTRKNQTRCLFLSMTRFLMTQSPFQFLHRDCVIQVLSVPLVGSIEITTKNYPLNWLSLPCKYTLDASSQCKSSRAINHICRYVSMDIKQSCK